MESSVEYVQGSEVKVGSYIVVDNRPCVVKQIDSSQPGKHGASKSTCWARDMFTNKRKHHMFQNHAQITVPVVTQKEYTLLDITEDKYLVLMDETGDMDESFKLPEQDLGSEITKMFNADKTVIVTVVSAMGEDAVKSCRESKE